MRTPAATRTVLRSPDPHPVFRRPPGPRHPWLPLKGPSVIVLSSLSAVPILAARAAGASTVEASPDLGISLVPVRLAPDVVRFPDEEPVPWSAVEAVCRHSARDRAVSGPCFLIRDGLAERISIYSEHTGRVCSLLATPGAPTIVLAGFPMHRTKGVDPLRDTVLKVQAVALVVGRVLDTTTGLGYTAIEAARTAAEVVTVELDPAVLAVARLNPWSRELLESKAITQLVGDSAEVVTRFEDESFARIVHDPPTVSLAGELYGGAFYRELHRVLKRGGRLFHYVGDLDSGLGRRVAGGVVRRLKDAGFTQVRGYPRAFGVVAVK